MMIVRTWCRRLHARVHEEDGFTLVEALVAVTVLAVGAFAVAQSLTFGLEASGASRQRLAGRSAADQQMELARALNYDSLVLDDALPLTHSTDTTDPDFWVDGVAQTYDHDGSGGDPPEPIVRIAGASPALHHLQTPVTQGNTDFTIYMYVTWVDSPEDGVGAADDADGNGDGDSDADGQDTKRTTVVITWADVIGGLMRSLSMSSIFSDGTVPYHGETTPANAPPTVGCPNYAVAGLTATFDVTSTDSDGTVTQIDWDYGDGNSQADAGATPSHTYASAGTYPLVNTVHDDDGATATNSGQSCSVSLTAPPPGTGPQGTIVIAGGATYTTQTQVTLTVSVTSGTATQMQFSDDGITWSTPTTYTTSTIYTLPSGDGTKTVYARFINTSGTAGASAPDMIQLDTTAPGAPTNLTATSSTSGSTKTVNLSWTAPVPLPPDLAGYQVWKRLTSGTTWVQVATCTSGTSCTDSYRKQDNYEFYVVSVDNAGNISAQSNHITK
jgi:type II secretory pathway pseudopilin PulG